MFTGIIQTIGTVTAIDKSGDWTITIAPAADFFAHAISLGASIAHDGVCLTIVRCDGQSYDVQASAETLSKTTLKNWSVGRRVNLERALRVGDELGGHIVSGHVDGLARLVSKTPEGESLRLRFSVPEAFARFIAPKGSIALDGISLTVNEVDGNDFGVNIIPHTQTATTLGAAEVGDVLNFEIDPIARYVARMMGEA